MMNGEWISHRDYITKDSFKNLKKSDDLISRQAAIDAIWDGINMDIYTREVKEILEELPTAEPEYEGKGFLEFLWNVINPNEMESYLAMYNSKGVPTDG